MELTTAEPYFANVDYEAMQKEILDGRNKNDRRGISYYDLVANNREYRIFITSYLIANLGEWLTYIASIDFIETDEVSKTGTTSPTAISLLIIVRLLPNVFLACCGGTLADAHDRRNIMVVLNFAGAACALLFVAAYQFDSVFLIYFATFLQQCIAGLYQPSSSSIIPMLVTGDDELKKATTLEGLCWSGMAAFGASASGIVVDAFGSRICFCTCNACCRRVV
jgi:MFS family permease